MVDLVRSGRRPEGLSREFGPSAQAIRNWVRQADRDQGIRADGLTASEYTDIAALAQDILSNRRGQRVLVVGHADTIQPTVQALCASANECVMTGDEYDNLCMVTIVSKGPAHRVNLQYGNSSP